MSVERGGGVPRLLNTMATQVLLAGALRGLSCIDSERVADIADDGT